MESEQERLKSISAVLNRMDLHTPMAAQVIADCGAQLIEISKKIQELGHSQEIYFELRKMAEKNQWSQAEFLHAMEIMSETIRKN